MCIVNFTRDEIESCYNFAWSMIGNHNPNMIMARDDWQIFRDDFRGKLGEVAVIRYIKNNITKAVISTYLDFSVTPRGQWDIMDLEVNNKAINVKSIKQRSKFLLVEAERYDEYGNYRYNNNDGRPVPIDYYILVRVTVDPDSSKSVLKERDFNHFINNAWNYINRAEVKRNIYAEILGGISHEDFWNKKIFAPKHIECNVTNLKAVVEGKKVRVLSQDEIRTRNPNSVLQQDNFVISSENQLSKLEEIFGKNE